MKVTVFKKNRLKKEVINRFELHDLAAAVIVMGLSIVALASCALAPSFTILALSLFAMGLVTISGQVILPLAGDLSRDEERGHIVGIVSSGIQKKESIWNLSSSSSGGNTSTKAVMSVVLDRSSPP